MQHTFPANVTNHLPCIHNVRLKVLQFDHTLVSMRLEIGVLIEFNFGFLQKCDRKKNIFKEKPCKKSVNLQFAAVLSSSSGNAHANRQSAFQIGCPNRRHGLSEEPKDYKWSSSAKKLTEKPTNSSSLAIESPIMVERRWPTCICLAMFGDE